MELPGPPWHDIAEASGLNFIWNCTWTNSRASRVPLGMKSWNSRH